MKPVWRVNTGNGVPSDAEIHPTILFRDGYCLNSLIEVDAWNWSIMDKYADIIAYQTTRTKAAKYERVNCSCSRTGLILETLICPHCNGKGYTLEKIG